MPLVNLFPGTEMSSYQSSDFHERIALALLIIEVCISIFSKGFRISVFLVNAAQYLSITLLSERVAMKCFSQYFEYKYR